MVYVNELLAPRGGARVVTNLARSKLLIRELSLAQSSGG